MRTRIRPLKRRIRDAALYLRLKHEFPRMEFVIHAYRVGGISYVRIKAVNRLDSSKLLLVRDIPDHLLYGQQSTDDLLISQLWLVNPPEPYFGV